MERPTDDIIYYIFDRKAQLDKLADESVPMSDEAAERGYSNTRDLLAKIHMRHGLGPNSALGAARDILKDAAGGDLGILRAVTETPSAGAIKAVQGAALQQMDAEAKLRSSGTELETLKIERNNLLRDVCTLKDELREANGELSRQEQIIHERDRGIDTLAKRNIEMSEQITNLEASLAHLNDCHAKQVQTISEQAGRIDRLTELTASRAEEVKDMRAILADNKSEMSKAEAEGVLLIGERAKNLLMADLVHTVHAAQQDKIDKLEEEIEACKASGLRAESTSDSLEKRLLDKAYRLIRLTVNNLQCQPNRTPALTFTRDELDDFLNEVRTYWNATKDLEELSDRAPSPANAAGWAARREERRTKLGDKTERFPRP